MPTRTTQAIDCDHPRDEIVTPRYITLAEAAKALPPGRNGRPTNVATIFRWVVSGTISPTGERIRLRAVRMGGRWLTTREWLNDYAHALTPTFGVEEPIRTAVARARSADRASAKLDALGI